VLLFVSPPTPVGLRTARRLFDLAQEMGIEAGTTGVVVNQALDPERARELCAEQFARTTVELLGILEQNKDLAEHDARGEPLLGLAPDNPVYGAVSAIMSRIARGGATKK
jgi:CO dehydrogenase nickel-insertion accessory protein CooC1